LKSRRSPIIRSRIAVASFLAAGWCCSRRTPGGGAPALQTAPASAKEAGAAAAGPAPTDLAGYRTAFDLVDNRIQAVSHRDGRLVIDAGSPDLLKFIDGDWKTSWIIGEKDQGAPAALVGNISSLLYVPIDADGDGAGGSALRDTLLSITCRALLPKQKVSIFVNEKPVGTLDIDGPSRRYDFTVPAAALKLGENRLRLTFRGAGPVAGGRRSAAAVTSIEVGPAALGPAPAGAGARSVAAKNVDLGGTRRRALTLGGKSARISYYLQVPAGAQLALAYGAPAGAADVLVRVAADGRPARTVYEGHAQAAWTDAVVDLSAAAGRASRIDLVSRGGEVAWGDPRVVVKAAPAPAPVAVQPRFDRVFVWMVDTLRADKVHVYNPKTRVQTPTFDAFAADATRFEWAQVPGTWSLPSHASLLTGVYPSVHKAVAAEARLSKEVPFVAEEMRKAGYRTAMYSSNGYISSKWGFDRGWDVNRNFIRESLPNGADYLWKTAKPWVMAGLKKREFVYFATIEPHVIYNPKKEFLIKYWNKPYHGPIKPVQTGVQLGLIKGGKLKINDNDRAYLEALHDAEITGADALFAAFIADLKKAGIYETSAVILVSDHGDEFWEHGSVGHGHSVYQELVHVPLVIRAPGLFPVGKVVRSDVEIMDLCATLLDLAGIKRVPAVQGTTLLPLALDEVGKGPRAAFTMDGSSMRGLKVARYRLVNAQKMELYDELDDPREQKNIAADHPIALRQMRNVFGVLYGYEQRWNKTRWGTAANLTPEFDRDVGLN
jgi:choline-sulfatase